MDNMLIQAILTSPVAIALFGYVVLMFALAVAMQPVRVQLTDAVEEMLAEPHWSDSQRDELNLMLDHCMSFRVGVLLIFASLSVVFDIVLSRPTNGTDDEQALSEDPRFGGAVWRFLLSVSAANPLAFVIAMPIMIVSLVIALISAAGESEGLVDQAFEQPTLRALDAFTARHSMAAC